MRIAAAMVLLLSATPIAAASGCDGLVSIELCTCKAEAYAQVENKMNAVFAEVLDAIGPEDASQYWAADRGRGAHTQSPLFHAIRSSQEAWVAHRDIHCEALYLVFGGTHGATVEQLECLHGMTERRIEDLRVLPVLPLGQNWE